MSETDQEYNNLLFGIRRSVRYHNRRVNFYDRLRSVILFCTTLAGTATVAAAVEKNHTAALAVGFIVAVLSTLEQVVNSAGKARRHTKLAQRFIELETMLILAPPTPELIREWTAKRLKIEADEPPVLRVLDVICHNELMRAMGYGQEEMKKISRPQKFFADFFDFKPDSIPH